MLIDINKKERKQPEDVPPSSGKNGSGRKVVVGFARREPEKVTTPETFISSQDEYLSKHLRNIDYKKSGETYHFTSNGRFALHDIAIHIASKLENAEVTLTSFNVSVIAAKLLLRAWDKGFFKSLRFVLNAQKKSNFKNALQLIEGKFPISYKPIHAKVALIRSGEHYITVVTSGNLSSNGNIERGFISTSKAIYDFDNEWISQLF